MIGGGVVVAGAGGSGALVAVGINAVGTNAVGIEVGRTAVASDEIEIQPGSNSANRQPIRPNKRAVIYCPYSSNTASIPAKLLFQSTDS